MSCIHISESHSGRSRCDGRWPLLDLMIVLLLLFPSMRVISTDVSSENDCSHLRNTPSRMLDIGGCNTSVRPQAAVTMIVMNMIASFDVSPSVGSAFRAVGLDALRTFRRHVARSLNRRWQRQEPDASWKERRASLSKCAGRQRPTRQQRLSNQMEDLRLCLFMKLPVDLEAVSKGKIDRLWRNIDKAPVLFRLLRRSGADLLAG